MKTFEEIQKEIGNWSKANFKDNPTKIGDNFVSIGYIAPLLGIVEEFGEFINAGSTEDQFDAVGDMLVYFCDYTYRIGAIPTESYYLVYGNKRHNIGEAIGKLYHVNLKRIQGIRGYDDDLVYFRRLQDSINYVYGELDSFSKISFSVSALFVLESTWEKVVKKRDWVQNKESGSV